jgi:hypothetical protein
MDLVPEDSEQSVQKLTRMEIEHLALDLAKSLAWEELLNVNEQSSKPSVMLQLVSDLVQVSTMYQKQTYPTSIQTSVRRSKIQPMVRP